MTSMTVFDDGLGNIFYRAYTLDASIGARNPMFLVKRDQRLGLLVIDVAAKNDDDDDKRTDEKIELVLSQELTLLAGMA